ncbi:MAG TPA: crosslink repair DNA glycosylase YcaQ family protein, partial [Micromonospora sp.]
FLPAFDNAVLGFDDRSRIIDDADRGLSVQGARFVLVDGRVAGTWTTERDAVVRVTTHRPLANADFRVGSVGPVFVHDRSWRRRLRLLRSRGTA